MGDCCKIPGCNPVWEFERNPRSWQWLSHPSEKTAWTRSPPQNCPWLSSTHRTFSREILPLCGTDNKFPTVKNSASSLTQGKDFVNKGTAWRSTDNNQTKKLTGCSGAVIMVLCLSPLSLLTWMHWQGWLNALYSFLPQWIYTILK